MHRKQRGFLIALVPLSCYLCPAFSECTSYRRDRRRIIYRKHTARPAGRRNRRRRKMLEREAANSTGTSGQRPDTQENETDEAKIETEEDLRKIGEAELAQAAPEESEEEQQEEPEQVPVQESSAASASEHLRRTVN